MGAVTLNYWLGKFVIEVAKKSGERCPSKTVYGIICGIRCYLEENGTDEGPPPYFVEHWTER